MQVEENVINCLKKLEWLGKGNNLKSAMGVMGK